MILDSTRTALAFVPGDVPAFAKAVLDAIHDASERADKEETVRALADLERRVCQLELVSRRGQRLSGRRVTLLEYVLTAALEGGYGSPAPDDLMRQLSLTVAELKETTAELESLELVGVHGNLNHPTGIARLVLSPKAYLRVGTDLLPGVPVVGELWRVLKHLHATEAPRVVVSTTLESLNIPEARGRLLLAAMDAYDLVRITKGSVPYLALLPGGQRLLRRDDPIAWQTALS